MCILSKFYIPKITIHWKHISWNTVKEIWSLSFSALIISFSAIIFQQTQLIVVGKVLSVESVALYTIPLMLMRYSSMLISYIHAAFVPFASEMDSKGQINNLRRLNIQGVRISFVIALGLLTVTYFFGKPFLMLWLKTRVLDAGDFNMIFQFLLVMLIGFSIGYPQIITNRMFLGSGKHWFVAIVSVSCSVTSIFIGYFLLKYTTFGILGMVIGWCMFFIITGVFIYPFAACKLYNINIISYLGTAYLVPIISILPFWGGCYLISHIILPVSFLQLLVSLLSAFVIYIFTTSFVCLDQSFRNQIFERIRLFL